MRQRLEVVAAVLVVIVLLAALAWAVPQWLAPLPTATPGASPTTVPTPPTAPAGTPGAEETRAILVSLAGMRPDLMEQYVQQGQMPHLAQLGADGARAEYAQAVYPPLGAPSHAAIASGAYANVTGV
ncbi:MAG: alkaline phosphatase family protein, partial [Chloroflexi bacterium]|nr:alkaline phosphatase family protein [Chloroflexota bacterium]